MGKDLNLNSPQRRTENYSPQRQTGLKNNLNDYEIKIQRSRFIGHVEPCFSDEQAREILKKIKAEYRDATHNCYAYVINSEGYKSEFSSDNGEPPGTAGRPILGAIKRSGLENIIVIVTRYFGGKKLGVRGLIDAYGLTAEKTLELNAGGVES